MYYRRKIFLTLLKTFGGSLASIDFEKLLFLYCQFTKTNYYDFFPYKYGCFSHVSYLDKRVLTNQGYLKESEKFILNKKVSFELKQEDKISLNNFVKRYNSLNGQNLVKYTYKEYPYFAIKSEIAKKILNNEELKKINDLKPDESRKLLTIGYEGLTIDYYINILISNNIKLVVDVRKNPLSMKYGFSKTRMKNYLEKAGISYIHIPELGIDSHLRKNLKTSSDYKELFEYYYQNILPEQKKSILYIIELLNKFNRIALTCFEAEHTSCHRHKITNWFVKNNINESIVHI